MTSKIKVDNINKVSDDSNIINKSGTTITLGASGDTINLASGASQSGFGRTGTVDWITTPKTATFTAVSGEGYFVNTTGGVVTVNLPAGSAGAIVSVSDYAGTAATNNILISANGTEKIESGTTDARIYENRDAITLVYVDAVQGWLPVNNNEKSGILPPAFITATGGTITTVCTDYKVHTFTGPGTFTVCSVGNPLGSSTVDYLTVAGGGGGGYDGGGGGGAGGFRESSGTASGSYSASPLGACVSALPVAATGYPIVIGGGGANSTSAPGQGTDGNQSSFSTIISAGGGGGGGCGSCLQDGRAGGSGGGVGRSDSGGGGHTAGAGNTPTTNPSQGNPGGTISPNPSFAGAAGGGGATVSGGAGNTGFGGAGGNGATTSISASPVAYGGGGGGAGWPTGSTGGTGGTGGGSPGAAYPGPAGSATINRGGGGGGMAANGQNSSSGSSGIVIIRYKFQ